MFSYQDPKTGYQICQYTKGPERNAKLYFTTESFSVDDRYFFFNKQWEQDHPEGGLWRVDEQGIAQVCTIDLRQVQRP